MTNIIDLPGNQTEGARSPENVGKCMKYFHRLTSFGWSIGYKITKEALVLMLKKLRPSPAKSVLSRTLSILR